MKDQLFKFEDDEIKMHIQYEMELFRKIRKPLLFVFDKMKEVGHYLKLTSLKDIDLNKVNWYEGKSYYWGVVAYKNVKLLIRRYNTHFTIFSHLEGTKDKISAFTFYCDTSSFDGDEDEYYENPFIDLNKYFKDLITKVAEDKVHWLTNSVSFKIPKHCKVKHAFWGERMYSVDNLIFCSEELSCFNLQLFAETEMFEKVKQSTDRVGEQFDSTHTVDSVNAELEDDYYHGVGFSLKDEDGKTEFKDVYSLTRWHFDDVYKEEEK